MKKYPFKFLDAYTKADKAIFFGREEEVDELYRMTFQANLMLVYGASGTGKTSLIRCGLANRFKPSQWLDLYIRRGSDINQSLLDMVVKHTPEKALAVSEAEQSMVSEAEPDWFESLMEEEQKGGSEAEETPTFETNNPVAQALQKLYLSTFTPIYLIFDQFEELYTLGNRDEQRRLTETIAELVQLPLPLKIIIVMREEYLARLYDLEKAVPQLRNKKLRIEPMGLPQVEGVILSATARNPDSNIELEEGREEAIAKAIIEKVRERDVDIKLPYLQVYMDRLYETATGEAMGREQEALFTLEFVNQMGAIGDVLADFIDRQSQRIYRQLAEDYDGLPTDIAWQILSPFATVDGTKIPIHQEELAALPQNLKLPGVRDTAGLMKAAVAELENSRILRYRKEEGAYEVAHDTLALQIAEKRSEEEKAYLKARRVVTESYATYQDTQTYLSREQLVFIRPYEERLEKEIDPGQKVFIADSQKKRKRQMIFLWSGIALAFVLAVGVILIVINEQRNTANALSLAEQREKEAKVAQKETEDALSLAEQREDEAKAAQKETASALAESQKSEAKALKQTKLANRAKASADSSAQIAQQKTDDLETYARQAMPVLIQDIDNMTLYLKYDAALASCKIAWNLDPGNKEVSRRIQEVAYFFTESGAYEQAENFLAFIGRKPAKPKREPGQRREELRSVIKQIDFNYWQDSLETRYYPNMIPVEGGSFCMGRDPKIRGECDTSDTKVILDDFKLGRTEVTVWQYNLYCKSSGRDSLKRIEDGLDWELQGNYPIVRTSWYDAIQYCNWVSKQKGLAPAYSIDTNTNNTSDSDDMKWIVTLDSSSNGFRLPTDAEWEYAARGGINRDTFKYSGSSDLDLVAWHYNNSNGRTHIVAQKKPNSLEIFDMSGNVWEWCWDWYDGIEPGILKNPLGPDSGSRRLVRGGSWSNLSYARGFEVSGRGRDTPSSRYDVIGFRLSQD